MKITLAKQLRTAWHRTWIVFLLMLTSGICCAQSSVSKPSAGKEIFETICASCHGLNGKGGERGPDIATKPRIVNLSDSQTLRILRDGKPQAGMPGFSGIGSARIAGVLEYLRKLQGKGKPLTPAATADVATGKELFTGKAGCSRCHMVQGRGGFIGPDLSDYGANHSADDIRSAILDADKRPGFRKALATATTSDGQQYSGLVRNEDNFSVQLQSLDGGFHLLRKSSLAELSFESTPLMPGDYRSKLSEGELKQLVAYLLSVGSQGLDKQAAGSN